MSTAAVPDANPVLDFAIDKAALKYIGEDLQRPECILAEPDGTLWSADARGGVVRINRNGSQTIITQKRSAEFAVASSEASRYLEGTLPNGLAFARNGDFLISNFGTDRLEVMTRDGNTRVRADRIDGQPIGKVNFVLRDSKDRIWVTVSTKVKNWMHALRTDLADGMCVPASFGLSPSGASPDVGCRHISERYFDHLPPKFSTLAELAMASIRCDTVSRYCASANLGYMGAGRGRQCEGVRCVNIGGKRAGEMISGVIHGDLFADDHDDCGRCAAERLHAIVQRNVL